MNRLIFIISSCILAPLLIYSIFIFPQYTIINIVILVLFIIGWHDIIQKKNAILRDYPVIGHLRHIFRSISPELQQYFIETNTNGKPFNKNEIRLINSRSNNKDAFHPFGTELDFYNDKVAWVGHSLAPAKRLETPPKVKIGGKHCTQKYNASLLNVSAMSFGSLSSNAIKALNLGAKKGGYYHNTGEGGITPYHRQGGDVVIQIGTGNFGFRDDKGFFNDKLFKEKSSYPEVKMIEIKLSQGAKPGHGGVLPAAKNTEEIAEIRVVKPHVDVLSPPTNPEMPSIESIPKFIARVRELSGNKPVGFKLCIGIKSEFEKLIDICINQDSLPDFITVDASEGGTGAAPLEYSDHIGMKGEDALQFVHETLLDKNVRSEVKIIYAGKIIDGFSLYRALCFGADLCNSARGFMFSLGCIQALKCHTNKCPTGIATQNKSLEVGVDPAFKSIRSYNYHKRTIESFLEILSVTGISDINTLNKELIQY